MLGNIVWSALTTDQARFAEGRGDARKYAAEVAPFAALARQDAKALSDLASLLQPEERTYLVGDRPPENRELVLEHSIEGLQMIFAEGLERQKALDDSIGIELLDGSDAEAMMQLTALAFPGFFRRRTCEMGTYFGVRDAGTLIAMAGERICLGEYREISGVCTHPEYRGRGYAAALLLKLMAHHRRNGLISFLHVSSGNTHAIELYERLGFRVSRSTQFHRVARRSQ